jgi:hypothetical protein
MLYTIIDDPDGIVVLNLAQEDPVVLIATVGPYGNGWRFSVKAPPIELYSIEGVLIDDVMQRHGPFINTIGNPSNWHNTTPGAEALLRNYHSGSGGWVLYVDGPDPDNLPDDFAVFASSWQTHLPQMSGMNGWMHVYDYSSNYSNLVNLGRTSESESRARLRAVLDWVNLRYV